MSFGGVAGGVIGAVVGGTVGFFTGGLAGTYYGASIGFGFGIGVGTMLDMPKADVPMPEVAELSLSRGSEGPPIPDFLGTTKLTGTFIWYGNNYNIEQTSEAGGKGGGGSEYVSGYLYYLSFAQAIALGNIDAIYSIWRDNESVWDGYLKASEEGDSVTITLSDNIGSLEFYFGTQETADTSWASLYSDSNLLPAYKGLAYAYFPNNVIGTYNRCPVYSFVARKTPQLSWGANTYKIGLFDYNPAHSIYYILAVHSGIPTTAINETSFEEAAEILHDEDIGVTVPMVNAENADSIINDILQHIGGILRKDSDGKFELFLIRELTTAELDALETITTDHMVGVPTFSRKTWFDTKNEIKVQYPKRVIVNSEDEDNPCECTEDLELSTPSPFIPWDSSITIAIENYRTECSYVIKIREGHYWNGAKYLDIALGSFAEDELVYEVEFMAGDYDVPSVTYYSQLNGYDCELVYFDLYIVGSDGSLTFCSELEMEYQYPVTVTYEIEACTEDAPNESQDWFDTTWTGRIVPDGGCPPYYVEVSIQGGPWTAAFSIERDEDYHSIGCKLNAICCPEAPYLAYRLFDSKHTMAQPEFWPPWKYIAFEDVSDIAIQASSTVLDLNETSVLTANFNALQEQYCVADNVTWELSGDGSLEISEGKDYAVYTAPSSNADCNANADISLVICGNVVDTVHITITTGSDFAVKHYVYWGCVKSYTYECVNRFHYIYCSGYEQVGSIQEFCVYGSFGICTPPNGVDCSTVCYENDYYRDIRTAGAIAAGCCPPQLGY